MKWLKASPQKRIELTIPERPLLHACFGGHDFGDVKLDFDMATSPDVCADVRNLPFGKDHFAAAYMDCPWTAGWKKNISGSMRELLRVAPIVYILSPWTYGCSICAITDIWIAWTPGVNQTLAFIRYKRSSKDSPHS